MHVEAHPWKRIQINNREHNHAFVSTPVVDRFATVLIHRSRYRQPEISAGLRNLRVLKTTQSGFVGFVKDDYTSLGDARDRIFSTIVQSQWKYQSFNGLNYDKAFDTVDISNRVGDAHDPI